ncbi:MAG: DUF3854 domain-containing protein [Romboutsia sp.]|nr:DUF3854 domain-containing protein [Romboutsia sp.]
MKTKISVIEEGKKIELIKVLNYLGISVNSYKKAICPFHSDTRPSLSIWEENNIFKCFVCKEKGDVITFWNKYNHIDDYFIAAADLCYTFGIINDDDYNNILDWKNKGRPKKQSSSVSSELYEKYNKFNSNDYDDIIEQMKIKNAELDIANDEDLDKIYRLFISTTEDFYGKKISDEHKRHLVEERFINTKSIDSEEYFTFPEEYKSDFMDVFLDKLRENEIEENILQKVPGFYFNKKNKEYTFISKKALGIPIRNIDSLIVRIQLRFDDCFELSKYGWFASSFAKIENDDYKWGTGSGSISTVFIPKQIRYKTIIITEGHFKAKKISEEKGCIAISVQGVSNWKSIIPIFDEVIKKYNINKTSVLIAFDSDLKINSSVFDYAKLLGECISKKGFEIYYLTWKYEFGKGIDDVINNGHVNDIKRIQKKEFDEKVDLIDVLINSVSDIKIDKENKLAYFEKLENISVELLYSYVQY